MTTWKEAIQVVRSERHIARARKIERDAFIARMKCYLNGLFAKV